VHLVAYWSFGGESNDSCCNMKVSIQYTLVILLLVDPVDVHLLGVFAIMVQLVPFAFS